MHFLHFFCSLTNREVARLFSVSAAPAGGHQADEKRAIVEFYRCRYSTHFKTDFRRIHNSVATRDPRFPRSGGRCRNTDSAFPCSKGRDIHIYIVYIYRYDPSLAPPGTERPASAYAALARRHEPAAARGVVCFRSGLDWNRGMYTPGRADLSSQVY